MAKRQTATEKWEDPWFCELSTLEKLFWLYLLDKCDHAGIWQANWRLVKFHMPEFVYNPETFKDRIVELSPAKWFIPKFIGFQYLTLNPDNRVHASVISRLQKEGAWKGLASPIGGHKDKDKEQDKAKDKDKAPRFTKPEPGEVTAYAITIGFPLDGEAFCDWYEARGWLFKTGQPMKDWKAAVRTWKRNNFNPQNSKTAPLDFN